MSYAPLAAVGSTQTSSFRLHAVGIIIFRIWNACICKTFFQPDEYYQSLEVAHNLVFGYGYRTWEWRPTEGAIRSPLGPLLYAPVYWALKVTGLDHTNLLTLAPKAFQGLIAAFVDVYTYKFAYKLTDKHTAQFALYCSLLTPFHAFVTIRTFSNSVETALTAFALCKWPFANADNTKDLAIAYSVAALACMIRPTNAFIWVHLSFKLCQSLPVLKTLQVVLLASAIGAVTVFLSFCVDSSFYGTPTLTAWNFAKQNILQSTSLFYGVMSWHYYFIQGIPLLCWNQLTLFVYGFWQLAQSTEIKQLKRCLIFVIACFSLVAHKEVRFIQPLIPIMNVFSALTLASQKRTLQIWYPLVIFSLLPTLFVLRWHQAGQVTVMDYLRQLPTTELRSAAFLMPCHSTPWQSHMHRKDLEEPAYGGSGDAGRFWFITCEPPILGQNHASYRDQSDFFYQDPVAYLNTRFPANVNPGFPPSPLPSKEIGRPHDDLGWRHEWPSHILLFQDLRAWNTYWHVDSRRRGDIVVLKWSGPRDA